MVTAYWEIGEQIYKACGENDRAEYGIRLLEYLSAKLTAEFGKGFVGHHGHLPFGGDRIRIRRSGAIYRPIDLYFQL